MGGWSWSVVDHSTTTGVREMRVGLDSEHHFQRFQTPLCVYMCVPLFTHAVSLYISKRWRIKLVRFHVCMHTWKEASLSISSTVYAATSVDFRIPGSRPCGVVCECSHTKHRQDLVEFREGSKTPILYIMTQVTWNGNPFKELYWAQCPTHTCPKHVVKHIKAHAICMAERYEAHSFAK